MSSTQTSIAALNRAAQEHRLWRGKLKHAVRTCRADVSAQQAADDATCEFGRWLRGRQIDETTRQSEPFRAAARAHVEFHACAGRILHLVAARRIGEAERILGTEFARRADLLDAELAAWKRALQGSDRPAA